MCHCILLCVHYNFINLKIVIVVECSVDTVKTNEDQNVMARHLCGNFWWELQTETIIPSLHKLFGLFSISYTDFCYSQL